MSGNVDSTDADCKTAHKPALSIECAVCGEDTRSWRREIDGKYRGMDVCWSCGWGLDLARLRRDGNNRRVRLYLVRASVREGTLAVAGDYGERVVELQTAVVREARGRGAVEYHVLFQVPGDEYVWESKGKCALHVAYNRNDKPRMLSGVSRVSMLSGDYIEIQASRTKARV